MTEIVEEFRVRARSWLEATAAPRATGSLSPAEELDRARAFQAALFDAGLAGITWPAECGGQGLTQAHLLAFNEEAGDFDLPISPFLIGLGMCGPTLVDLGTSAQQARYLRPLLRGEEIWCQLFSEPGAGSDVASLQSKAVPDGDGWLLNGQKVWTTGAQYGDFGAVLARTDPEVPKHRGLTMFIVDMRAPGVTVRPLRVMTGAAPFNEVFFADVRIPADAVLGSVNEGWTAAVAMLGHERVSIGGAVQQSSNPLAFSSLVETARRHERNEDPVIRDELVGAYLRERALQLLNARLKQEANTGKAIGARGSVLKLVRALNAARAVDVAGMVAGSEAIAWTEGDTAAAALSMSITGAPGLAIAGGTNEVQRNILGDRVLGLPKEPQVDRDVPFRELRVGTQREI